MTTYYIASSDANPGVANTGTRDLPFTLAEAMELANRSPALGGAQPGDTFLFLGGTYRNASYGNGDIWKEAADTIIKLNDVHGTAEAPITFAAAPGEAVKLQYDGNGAIVARGSSHIRIEGFEIEGPGGTVTLQNAIDAQWQYRVNTGTTANPIYEYHEIDPLQPYDLSGLATTRPFMFNSAAISLPNGSHHIEITGNTIHDATAHAVSAHGGNDYITVTSNEIYSNVRYTSVGGHAISFKGLDSGTDTSEAVRIVVTNNYLHDNNNLLVSWSPAKTEVHIAIDEGKSIHIQDATAAGTWDHGTILVANNVIERSGNAAITTNNADRVHILNNTIVDAGYLNQIIIAGGADPLAPDFRVNAGIRLAGGSGNIVANNLISLSDSIVYAVDADPTVTSANTISSGNIVSGGAGLNFRADSAALSAGFTVVSAPGFINAAGSDYRLLAASEAIDAADPLHAPASDYDGTARPVGAADVGAYEASAPTGITISAATVAEFAASGRIVGSLAASDANPGDAFTYELLDDAGGRFTLDGNQLTIAAGLLLDYEQARQHSVILKVTDDSGYETVTAIAVAVANVEAENVRGSTGADRLVGGLLGDMIRGNSGNDSLSGGAGNDRLVGERGRDYLTGGSGADIFDFNATIESGTTGTTRDLIMDFRHGSDRIDLSTIDANGGAAGHTAFKLLAAKGAAFTETRGELRWYQTNPAGTLKDRTIVEADINGDGRADLQIALVGLKTLNTKDFVL